MHSWIASAWYPIHIGRDNAKHAAGDQHSCNSRMTQELLTTSHEACSNGDDEVFLAMMIHVKIGESVLERHHVT